MQSDADHQWALTYDGSSDRCKQPVTVSMVCNPIPLVVSVDDHQGQAYYGVQQHKANLDRVLTKCKDEIDPEFECVAFLTDNERTMKSLRKAYNDEGLMTPGCGTHAVNKEQERYFKMDENKETMKKVDELQKQIKNDKIRQFIQLRHRGMIPISTYTNTPYTNTTYTNTPYTNTTYTNTPYTNTTYTYTTYANTPYTNTTYTDTTYTNATYTNTTYTNTTYTYTTYTNATYTNAIHTNTIYTNAIYTNTPCTNTTNTNITYTTYTTYVYTGNTEQRVGIDAPNDTRWSTKHGNMEKQIELKSTLRQATEDAGFKDYISESNTATIQDFGHWRRVQEICDEAKIFNATIKTFEGMAPTPRPHTVSPSYEGYPFI